MAGVTESSRQRIAFVLIGIGVVLTLVGFGLLFLNSSGEPVPVTTQASSLPPQTKVRVLQQVLFWLVVLIVLFAVSTLAFLRWSRHFRRSLLRKPHSPTPSEDVWAMHKLPQGAVEDWGNPDSSAGEDEQNP